MHLRKYVRQIRPIQENYIKPEDKVQNLLSEAYSFFPKSEEEISKTLSDFPHENVQDIINLFNFLKGKDPKRKGVLRCGNVSYLSGRGGGGNIASQFGMGKRGAEKMRKNPFELKKGGVVKMRGGGIIARDRLKPTKIT